MLQDERRRLASLAGYARELHEKVRNVVERCINRLIDFRAVATRYDKRGRNYLAGVLVASIIMWL